MIKNFFIYLSLAGGMSKIVVFSILGFAAFDGGILLVSHAVHFDIPTGFILGCNFIAMGLSWLSGLK